MTVGLSVVVLTHVGSVRGENQDRIVAGRWVLAPDHPLPEAITVPPAWPMVAVLDGMGGHTSGARAAVCAAEVLAGGSEPITTPAGAEAIVNRANDALFAQMAANPGCAGMGTTVAALVVADDDALVVNVGDSRVYSEMDGYLTQLSVDDAVGGGRLTQCLGGLTVPQPLDVHVTAVPWRGRRFVLASDGLFGEVPDEVLERCFVADDVATAGRLLETALAAGGSDNVSVAIVRCGEEPSGEGRR